MKKCCLLTVVHSGDFKQSYYDFVMENSFHIAPSLNRYSYIMMKFVQKFKLDYCSETAYQTSMFMITQKSYSTFVKLRCQFKNCSNLFFLHCHYYASNLWYFSVIDCDRYTDGNHVGECSTHPVWHISYNLANRMKITNMFCWISLWVSNTRFNWRTQTNWRSWLIQKVWYRWWVSSASIPSVSLKISATSVPWIYQRKCTDLKWVLVLIISFQAS